jgi:predicted PurR-regulated permease PerM
MTARTRTSSWNSRLAALASAAIIVLGLHFGRELIVPIVVAGLLGFVLMPSVLKLEHLGVRRVLGVSLVCGASLLAVLGVIWVVVVELGNIATTLPAYEQNIRLKLSSLGFDNLLKAFNEFNLSPPPVQQGEGEPPVKPDESAVPVRMVEGGGLPSMEMLSSMAGRMFSPVAFLGLTAVVLIFLLLSWEDVRERAIRLVSFGRLTLTTRAMDEAARTISEVLRLQLMVNAGFGFLTGLSLWLLGVPGAPLWGTLAVLLRFVPYIGMMLAAGMPVVLAIAVSDGWSLPIIIAAIFLLLDAIAGNFVEPWLFGSRAGVSTLALLVAAAFWTWLWGLPGLLLSTPITVGLAVVGRHVPQLKVLDVLLGDTPVLPPSARFYQRLIALDADDAGKVARAFQDEHRLIPTYETLFMPALRQIERDRQDEVLEEDRAAAVWEMLGDLIEEADDREPQEAVPPGVERRGPATVICLPARDEGDALAAGMLARAIEAAGGTARALSLSDLGGDIAAIIRDAEARVVCVSAVPPFAARHAKLRRRQVTLRVPEVQVLTGLWVGDRAADPPTQSPSAKRVAPPNDQIVTTLSGMVDRVREAQRSERAEKTTHTGP